MRKYTILRVSRHWVIDEDSLISFLRNFLMIAIKQNQELVLLWQTTYMYVGYSIAYVSRSTLELTVHVCSSLKLIVLLCLPFSLTSVEFVRMLFLAVRKRFCYDGTFLLVLGFFLVVCFNSCVSFEIMWKWHLKNTHACSFISGIWCTLITHVAENVVFPLMRRILQQDIRLSSNFLVQVLPLYC